MSRQPARSKREHAGGPKLAVIGAGSAIFSLNFIRDVCLTPRLAGSLVTLMDIDADRLTTAHTLATRYADELGVELTVEATIERSEALRNADFVINAALGPGHEQMRAGWRVAQNHGYRFGGSLHVMHDESFWINYHQLRLIESIVTDINELCPDAWYLQLANPVLAGMTLIFRQFPHLKAVGLCHGFAAVYRIADGLGVDRSSFAYDVAGVNHHLWMTDAFEDGRSVMPALNAALEENTLPTESRVTPVATDVYRRLGAFPVGDTCSPGGGGWPWWYHDSSETEQAWGEDPETMWDDYYPRLEKRVGEMRAAAIDTQPLTEVFAPEMSNEPTIPLIESIVHDIPRVLICNISNRGRLIPDLPEDFAVEVPAMVSRRGIDGLSPSPLPPAVLAQIYRDRIGPVSVELAAYTNGSRDLLEALVFMDPWTRSLDQAQALVDDILALPANREMLEHYQSTQRDVPRGAHSEMIVD